MLTGLIEVGDGGDSFQLRVAEKVLGRRFELLGLRQVFLDAFERRVAGGADLPVQEGDVGLESRELALEQTAFVLVVLKRAVVDIAGGLVQHEDVLA